MTDELDESLVKQIQQIIADVLDTATAIGYGDCMNETRSEFAIAQLGDSTTKLLADLIAKECTKARIDELEKWFALCDHPTNADGKYLQVKAKEDGLVEYVVLGEVFKWAYKDRLDELTQDKEQL